MRRPGHVIGWVDELEVALRAAGGELAELVALADERWNVGGWSPRDVRRARRELARRLADVPGLGDLFAELAGAGTGPAPRWLGLAPWPEDEPGPDGDVLRSADRLPPPSDDALPSPVPPELEAPPRLRIAERVLGQRTRSLVPVLERPVNPLNASAVLRTVESLGLQEVHVAHPEGRVLTARSITRSCERWIDLVRWREGPDAVRALQGRGYRVWAADFGDGAVPLADVPVEGPTAVVFGSEQEGVTPATRDAADGLFYVPTAGFGTYLNLSVSAAVVLHELDRRLRAAGRRDPLSGDECRALRRSWYAALAPDAETARAWAARADDPPPAAPAVRAVPSREKARERDGRGGSAG